MASERRFALKRFDERQKIKVDVLFPSGGVFGYRAFFWQSEDSILDEVFRHRPGFLIPHRDQCTVVRHD